MRTLLVAFSLLVSTATLAAPSAPVEDRPAVKLIEVERGFFLGVEAGGLFLFEPKGTNGGFSPGRSYGVTMGADLGERLSIAAMVLGTHSDAPSAFSGGGGANLRGDFSSLIVGAMLKVDFWGHPDANAIKRLFLYARGGGGYAFLSPKNFFKSGDTVVAGGLGLEYFTHLRHFSLGLSTDFFMGLSYMGPGVSVTPNMRYTF